jgi:hypothetical protein
MRGPDRARFGAVRQSVRLRCCAQFAYWSSLSSLWPKSVDA